MRQRRLAAIMFTDIVGYTALMQKDEAVALELLDEHNRLLRPIFSRYGGQEIKTMGDAFMIEFASALEAVRCAIELQESLDKRNSSSSKERRIQVRFGIHLGDVEHRGGDVFGDGVNIASRILSLAEQGGICISEDVHRQIRNKMKASTVSLGQHKLKGIHEPIEVYRVMPKALKEISQEVASLDKRRIVVLPFTNISSDPRDEYFSDGMTEEIISSLSKIRELKVASRSTAFRYRGKSVDPREVGRELGVGSVLDGSVRKHGSQLRITAQLISTADGFHLWSEEYDREMEDVFAIQSDIAKRVAEALKVQLLAKEKRQIEKQATEDLEAYNLYLKGRYYWNKRTMEGFQRAIEYFEQAIEKDQTYALAYAGLADSYGLLGAFAYGALPPREAMPKAKAATMKALKLDNKLAEAHTSLGWVLARHEWDWSGAERAYKRAIGLNPNYATAHHWYALYLMRMGRHEEAMTEMKRAQELDPLSLIINTDLGLTFYFSRHYDRAIEEHQKTLEMDQNFTRAHLDLGFAYLQKALFEEAIVEFKKALILAGRNPRMVAALGYAHALSGNTNEAMRILGELRERGQRQYVSSYYVAMIYVGLGEVDEAFAWLGKAYKERSDSLIALKVDPIFDSLRSDKRFTALLGKMKLRNTQASRKASKP